MAMATEMEPVCHMTTMFFFSILMIVVSTLCGEGPGPNSSGVFSVLSLHVFYMLLVCVSSSSPGQQELYSVCSCSDYVICRVVWMCSSVYVYVTQTGDLFRVIPAFTKK